MSNNELLEKFKSTDKGSFILEKHIYAYKKYLIENKPLSSATITDIVLELHTFDKFLMLAYPKLEDVKELKSHHIDFYCKFNLNELLLLKKTINRKLRAIRKLLDYLTNVRHLIEYNPALKVPYFKVDTEKLPVYIPKDILRIVLSALENRKSGIRDVVITKLLAYTGLQLKEIMDLRTEQVDLQNKKIIVNRGRKEYEFVIPSDLYKSLKSYMEYRKHYLMKEYTNFLFLSNTGNPYTARSYQYAFKEALISSDIQGNYTPRHVKASFAYYMAQSIPEEKLKVILNQNKVEHYYIDDLINNPLLPK
jgi:site-specific recombinase XerC